MKVGIVGSGGREHALCAILRKSSKISEIFCFPGNAGTSTIAQNIDLDANNFEDLKNFILKQKIDLMIIGPEKPLVEGIVDYFEKHKIKVFGPNKIAAQLEGSKIFTKKICQKYKIPTAKFGIFQNKIDSKKYLEGWNYPAVIKADNLASGKGVYICNDQKESDTAINEIFDGKFGEAKNILIEEFLEGEEMSFFIISDGKTFKCFGTAQDHKRVFEGDKGKNTGGMGAYSPSRLISEELEEKILKKIIKPTILGLSELNSNYRGFLYAGLMIVDNEPYLIEYNVRMGDPECQTILPRLKSDLVKIINSCCDETLDKTLIEWEDKKSLCVVLCARGYPESFQKGTEIPNLSNILLDTGDYLFHAGTKKKDNKIIVNGGRVLNFVSVSNEFKTAREKVHKIIEKVNWTDGFYRKDIGYKVIN
ncbi:phosphoribosylamine--glycine ligase [Candidatus Pelagibacter sp.]|nr:phosphoribosylamine--glycine ligase [Candidatus Pelagibacter sp.]|tara:strand:- start:27 stop:1289 length:1263 start_codon:yes stop_codon:yes gene_type:complete